MITLACPVYSAINNALHEQMPIMYLHEQNGIVQFCYKGCLIGYLATQKRYLILSNLSYNCQNFSICRAAIVYLPILFRYYSTIRPLYRHVIYTVPVSCKANGDRSHFGGVA